MQAQPTKGFSVVLPVHWYLHVGNGPPAFAHVLRVMKTLGRWVLVMVFIRGVLVIQIKLAGQASSLPGLGCDHQLQCCFW